MTGPKTDVFINYRRDDIYAAHLVYEDLLGQLPDVSIFLAGQSIRVGEQFPERLELAAQQCHVMIPIVGRDWADSLKSGRHPWALKELRAAWQAGAAILPLFLADELPYRSDPGTGYKHSGGLMTINPQNMPQDLPLPNLVGHEYTLRDKRLTRAEKLARLVFDALQRPRQNKREP